MIKIYKSTEIAREDIVSREMAASSVEEVVADIIYDVRKNGDEALLGYAKKFDKSDMTAEELLDAIKTLGIHDLWSGDWLWRRLTPLVGKIRRVVVDTTDDSGASFTEYRSTLRHPGEILGGAKILLHLLGATKAILLVDMSRQKVKEAFTTMINDPALLVMAETQVKYPMREETLFEAIYVRHLKWGCTAEEDGVLFIKAQTAAQLYLSMLTGLPHTTRILTAAGEGFGKNAVITLPLALPGRRFWRRPSSRAARTAPW
jgi:Na+-translocating ferredoxin:NAD+ oxidoreductase RnfC subunit